MGRTRIDLVSSGSIDMYDDVSSPINFAIADIREPEKRDASYSKTIKIPATKNNNKLFTHIFDLGLSDSSFNPNRKADCILYIDDVPQIYGYLQLLSIDVDDKSDMVYSCSIRGQVGNIFQKLGDTELRDLDYSSYSHTLNRINQKASWTNNHSNGYVYPMIDYGFDNNFNSFDTIHFLPSIFLRTYIDKIFSYTGYTYDSSFFDSTHFKNLIIPANDVLKYTESQIAAKLFEASISSNVNVTASNFPAALVPFNNDISDPANAFDTGISRWVAPTSGYYNISSDVSWTSSSVIPTWVELQKNGNNTAIASTYTQAISTTVGTINVNIQNHFLNAGDYIEVKLRCFSAIYNGQTYNVKTTSRFNNSIPNNGLQYGDTVDLSLAVPNKIKCKDLLSDVIKMFGLYVDVDKNDSNRLLIETRDDFYSSGTINDWTYKLDNSRVLEVTPMGELDFKVFNYKYKSDKDSYNSIYESKYNEVYSNRSVEVDSDFLTRNRTLEVMFSPTPVVASAGDDKVMPKIWEADNSGVVKFKPSNIRLLYYGGVLNTNNTWVYTDNGISYNETTYPYCGHLNSITAPTFDLSFAPPKELFYNTNIYTNANVYNLYHKKQIEEITSPDSKIIVGYFHLTPTDIFDLDFRNKFYFEGQYFRLNKIYDYDPINTQTTRCEFIKIKDGTIITASSSTINGGTGILQGDPKPVVTGQRSGIIVQGSGNSLGGNLRNAIIIGDNNYVHGGTNITLINSSGCTIYDGLSNVSIFNSSGTIVTESNSLIMFNTTITSGTIASLGNTEWSSHPYNSSDYYTDGGGTWAVDSADLINNKYRQVGKTLFWSLVIEDSTFSGGVTFPNIKLPNGLIVGSTFAENVIVSDGSQMYNDIFILGNEGNNYLIIKAWDSGPFSNSTNMVDVAFSLTFEIQ
jgi:hypothetical protein